MSSPLNDPTVTDWFRRFDAAAKHLPAEDRAAQHEELRQHLDALTAANVASGQSPEAAQQNALTRLGDPSQIGRKLDREWHKNQYVSRAAWQAIGVGIICKLALDQIGLALQENFGDLIHPVIEANFLLGGGAFLMTGIAVGLRYPSQALRGAFYGLLFWHLLILCIVLPHMLLSPAEAVNGHAVRINVSFIHGWLMSLPICTFYGCAAAYLASVTRRGWYRPSLADFKLSLPKKARA